MRPWLKFRQLQEGSSWSRRKTAVLSASEASTKGSLPIQSQSGKEGGIHRQPMGRTSLRADSAGRAGYGVPRTSLMRGCLHQGCGILRTSCANDKAYRNNSTRWAHTWHTLLEVPGAGIERWLGSQEHWLFFRKTQKQFPAPTWQCTTICNSSSRGSGALFWPPWALQAHGAHT